MASRRRRTQRKQEESRIDTAATELTAADISIIRSLQRDARSSIAKIAAHVGMPQSTVRHRLNKLVKAGVVQFTAATDPRKLGYRMWVIVEIQADLSKLRAVARELASMPEIHFLALTTGGFDLLATGTFRSNDDLLDFITNRLSAIPGVVRTTTGIILDLVKRTIAIGLPEGPADSGDGARAASRTARGRRDARGRGATGRAAAPR